MGMIFKSIDSSVVLENGEDKLVLAMASNDLVAAQLVRILNSYYGVKTETDEMIDNIENILNKKNNIE